MYSIHRIIYPDDDESAPRYIVKTGTDPIIPASETTSGDEAHPVSRASSSADKNSASSVVSHETKSLRDYLSAEEKCGSARSSSTSREHGSLKENGSIGETERKKTEAETASNIFTRAGREQIVLNVS